MEKPIITLLGGGTGQSNILRGLKKYDVELNSIVTMADDGGSSGILRQEMDILPPGDLRNCIIALSNIEPDMERLFQYRFKKGSLSGQNFGNLFLAAMNDIHGDLKKAISHTSKILAVRGNVYPVTYDNISLCALLKNGNIVKGESKLSKEVLQQHSQIEKVYIEPLYAKASEDAINAIRKSDIIIAGPGSLYTSILPVILVDNIREEIEKSNAIKIFITNIMSENGETDSFTTKDFLKEIKKHCKLNIFDYFIINNGNIRKDILDKYINKNQEKIIFSNIDREIFEYENINTILEDVVDIKNDLIFHNEKIIAQIVNNIYEKHYDKRLYFVE